MRRALLLAAFVIAIYAPYLQYVPPYLDHDEVVFGLQASSIASTGHDLQGRLFPLYFQVGATPFWATPIIVYVTALVLRVLPLSETVLRLPTVLVGLLDVLLLYAIAKRLFQRDALALIAAGLLALTPAHFIHARLALDHLYALPLMLGWLLCLLIFLEQEDLKLLVAGTTLLGVGVYSYMASIVMMPVFLLLTGFTLFLSGKRSVRYYAAAIAGFIMPLLLFVPWLALHPEQLRQVAGMYSSYDDGPISQLRGVKQFLSYSGLTVRAQTYYAFFDPSFLFFSGDPSMIDSTRAAGVFLLPLAVLLPIGINRIVNVRPTPVNLLVLLSFFLAPLAALLVGGLKINRALVMLPFGALIATVGIEGLLSASRPLWRWVAVVLLALVPLQFAVFYADYLGDYRIRSSMWFERNIRGALENVIARDEPARAPAVYLSRNVHWLEYYWPLYLTKHHRQDLLARTTYVDPRDLDVRSVPAGSIVMSEIRDIPENVLLKTGDILNVTNIAEPNKEVSFVVFETRR